MQTPDTHANIPRSLKNQQWRVAGNWEPKMFLYRRGDSAFIDVEKLWQQGHSDQAIERLQQLGINKRAYC